MKILFVSDLLPEHANFWRDGLWGVLQELEKDWHIDYLNLAESEEDYDAQQDFILGWGGTNSRVRKFVDGFRADLYKRGLCFGGGDITDPILDKFDVVFVENTSQLIKPHFKQAFGTNTDLFFYQQQPKIIDALYPAAFAKWKHQEIFADICQKENLKGLAVGYIQKNNLPESMGLVAECINKGVAVMDWIPAESLANLYNMSKEVIITADPSGGCERTVLEAKACGVPVRIISESQKLHDWNKLTPEEVIKDWNHVRYAESLKKGIESCLLS